MIKIDDYSIEQYVYENSLVISLPQTSQTVIGTTTPAADRKVKLSNDELAIILGIVKKMYEVK